MKELGLEEALDIAMEAELRARAFYAQAAVEIQDPSGRDLLGRLAAFEQYHYQWLADLARSLRDTEAGRFIAYETRSMEDFAPLIGGGEGAATSTAGLKEPADILIKAIEFEKTAGERYRVLAEETTDPDGRDMFRKLANEEMIHQSILEHEFFTLSNQGVWGWLGMYGE